MAMCIRERRSRSEGSRSARIPDAKYYDAAAGYKYNHTSILGFSLTHLSGTGIPDLGDFLFIPGTGEMKLEPGSRENPDEGYRSRYTHDEEQATPNYYAVRLQDYGVKAEMTAGVRSGMFRFTYPESEKSFIMIDMNHTLWQSCEWPTCAWKTIRPSLAISW